MAVSQSSSNSPAQNKPGPLESNATTNANSEGAKPSHSTFATPGASPTGANPNQGGGNSDANSSSAGVSTGAPSGSSGSLTGGPKTVTPGTGPQLVAPTSTVDTPVNPARAPAFQIHSNVNITRYLKALIYAEFGSGKTYLAGTAVAVAQMRDVLMMSAEAGELTLYEPDGPYPFHLIDVVSVSDYKTTARVHDFLKLHCSVRERASQGDEESRRNLRLLQDRLMPDVPDPDRLRLYKTVIIDSLTEVESYCMASLLGIDYETKLDEEINAPEWAEYNKQRLMIHRMIRNFRNLPMNIIFTCTRQFKENEQKRRIYAPQMTGKLAGEVQGFMDLVGYLVLGEAPAASEESPDPQAPRRLIIQPGPRHAAKSRFSRYKKPHFDSPTIPNIMQAVGLLEAPKPKG